jgi:hypothetical protein
MDMGFHMWNIKSLYRAATLMIVSRGTIQILARFSGIAGCQMGRQWHGISRRIYIFLRNGE